MRVRHKIPSIFNLSMVDVLCCALGCVILLWLLNLRDASQKADEVGVTTDQLSLSQNELAAAVGERDDLARRLAAVKDDLSRMTGYTLHLHTRIDDTTIQLGDALRSLRATDARLAATTGTLTAAQKERDALQKERDSLRVQAADLNKLLDSMRGLLKDTEGQMALKTKSITDLDGKLAAALQKITSLEKLVRDKDALALANGQKADSLAARLTTVEDLLKKTQGVANSVHGLELSVKDYRDRYMKEHALAQQLEKDINAKVKEIDLLKLDMLLLRGDKAKLAAAEDRIGQLTRELDRMRSTADNRFAGINLTGRRVVFLVDMSGSMDRVDKDTLAPGKWKAVRESLVKVMKSLPDLEKFQLILFGEKLQYALGSPDGWLNYDPAKTPDAVLEAMAAVRPEGGTNMHMGLEAAFKLKPQGLDTIYLLSDGLPNTGPNLTVDQMRNLKPTDQAEILGRYIRNQLKNDWNKSEVEKTRVRINCLGFFYESPDLGAFLWALARENDGNFVGMSQP